MMMTETDTESGELQKPSVITFYNLTKGGVDVVDRMKAEYSVTRFSNRWPFTVFCSLLNIAGINSHIIYYSNTDIKMTRRRYLTELAKALSKPHIVRRSGLKTLSIPLRQKIKNVLGKETVTPEHAEQAPQGQRPRCNFLSNTKK